MECCTCVTSFLVIALSAVLWRFVLRGKFNMSFKSLFTKQKIDSWKRSCNLYNDLTLEEESPKCNSDDSIVFLGDNISGSSLIIYMKVFPQKAANVVIELVLEDGTKFILPDTVAAGPLVNEHTWNSCGLKLFVLEPSRMWRIVFNGRLLDQDNQLHHVRLNFIWTGATAAVHFPKDWNTSLTADFAVNAKLKGDVLSSPPTTIGYTQAGMIQGEVRIDDKPPIVLNMASLRRRETLTSDEIKPALENKVVLAAIGYDGTVVHLDAYVDKNIKKSFVGGAVRRSNNVLEIVKDIKCDEFDKGEKFVINGSKILDVAKKEEESLTIKTLPYNIELTLTKHKIVIDGIKGRGFSIIQKHISENTQKPMQYERLEWLPLESADQSAICLKFRDRSATCPQLVGGKGASLALLTSLKTDEFQIPPGFCLTINAFDKHLSDNKELVAAIENIIKVNENYDETKMKNACETTVKLFNNTEIAGEVKNEILKYVDDLKSQIKEYDIYKDVTFAVRSSAIGEDSEELSAAGQNETLLGCKSNEQIVKAVQACWGSLFAYHSVTYRRIHGQPCRPGMGVVIQCVLSARAAGVLFSRHPTSGDPDTMLITANYGLGESVVSGHVEPDTILLSRDLKDKITFKSIEIGGKTHRVEVNRTNDGADYTTNVELSEKERSEACISKEESVKLAEIGVTIEKLWAMPMDIEWALANDKIYLLQARPITTLDNWTEFELLHELDDPIMSKEDFFTFANAGEVFPGACSPLCLSFVATSLENATSSLVSGTGFMKFIERQKFMRSHFRVVINMYNSLYMRLPAKLDAATRVLEVAMIGHTVADERIHKIGLQRNPPNLREKTKGMVLLLQTLMNRHKYVASSEYEIANFKLSLADEKSLVGKFKLIHDSSQVLYKIFYDHNGTSSASIFSQIVALSILIEDAEELKPEHYGDIAHMLSSCSEVVSAEVPVALAKIAKLIYKTGKSEEFASLPADKCREWLRLNCKEASDELDTFLVEHAHRNIKEFDFATKTWGLDPTSLLQSLQASTKSAGIEVNTKHQKSRAEIIQALKTPKKRVTRWLLGWVLPLCQSVVGCRERTKSLLIRAVHVQRLAYLELAEEMVKQWYLPEKDLIFYFTVEELEKYIKTRDPGLIKKASKRKQRLPKWNKEEFAEMNEGYLRPIEPQNAEVVVKGTKLYGTPVCGGKYTARACVVKNLSEVGQLQSGDILITHSTDIGWSPYFPIIGGIVTELGGLISHGAVIAREYGLPSIIGANNATKFCKTGDQLLLNAEEGYIAVIDE